MNRRQFLASLAAPAFAQPQRRPNVVVFLSDDMGYADIGCFGATDIRTPHIDRLARQGVKLTDCYSNGAVCTPTRCALMTGHYQQRYDLEWALLPSDVNQGLDPKYATLPRLLKNAGYKTAIYGKWHLGREPQFNPIHHGFDEYFGLPGGNVDMYSKEDRFKNKDLYEGTKQIEQPGYLTELLAERSEKFIAANKANPFFLYVPFNAVHWPFQAPDRPDTVRNLETWYDGTRAGEYKPMLESMDKAVGRVVAALEQHGLTHNTLVVFTNDNGGERLSDNGPYRHRKETLWEGGIRVPGIMKWPGKIPAGRVNQQACMTMDFTATIAEACGVKAHEPFEGIDLLPIVSGSKPVLERDLFWRVERPERHMRAVRSGSWKFVLDGTRVSLFDLASDPGETRDMHPWRPEITERLRAKLAAWEQSVKRKPREL